MPMRMRAARLLTACLLGSIIIPAATALQSQAAPKPPAAGRAGSFSAPDTALGGAWASSGDELVTGTGDSDGFHVMVAREKDAFAWQNLVTLKAASADAGPWTGEICTTGDGKYAVAVYALSSSVNTPALVKAGALVSVIDLTTGKATPVSARAQLAYYDPGCGLGDTVVLTRALGQNEQRTQLVDVDAATGRITATRMVGAQVTNAFHDASGDVGVAGGSLTRISANGSLKRIARLTGQAYSVVPTSRGIDTVSASGGRAVVQRWTGAKLQTLGRGKLTDLQLFPQAGGDDLLAGDTSSVRAAAGLRELRSGQVPGAVSRQGDLVTSEVVSPEIQDIEHKQVGAVTPSDLAGRVRIAATATHSDQSVSAVVPANGPVADFTSLTATSSSPKAANAVTASAMAAALSPASYTPGGANPSATGDYEAAVDLSNATAGGGPSPCLVPRNSPTDQALQPTASMVEWAVDQAVNGDLMVQRPADYLGTGQAAYQPQRMIPLSALDGPVAGGIPAQVELGILAQESNFDQASWHAVPGDSGNPLIADYYGTASASGTADNPDVVPDNTTTDCGYGIGQVTDGMSSIKDNPDITPIATAIGTDYAANIAASVGILADTWNQLADMSPRMVLNGGDPSYIENWYFAIWGYNSGVYSQSNASANGGYGIGWYNNPANPQYPANRANFGDNVTSSNGNDASQPQLWSYEEKVMGWIEHPQVKGTTQEYSQPTFGTSMSTHDPNYGGSGSSGPGLNLPGHYQFCTSDNSCSQSAPSNPCPSVDSSCWWHEPATWMTPSTANATTESLAYGLGSAEPAMKAQYPAYCPNEAAFRDSLTPGSDIVTDLNTPSENTRGCPWGSSDGTFRIRLGDNIALSANQGGVMQANPLSAQIDLHQIGAGFLGHFYFTHVYDGTSEHSATTTVDSEDPSQPALTNYDTVPAQVQHRVTGTWTPNPKDIVAGQAYRMIASIPDHGANASTVNYEINQGYQNGLPEGPSITCSVSQASNGNRWVDLGVYALWPGANVSLDNMVGKANGTSDVAFGTVIFEAEPQFDGSTDGSCGSADLTG